MSLIKSTAEFFRKRLPGHLDVQVYSTSPDRDELVVVVTTQIGASVTISGLEAARGGDPLLARKVHQLLQSLKSVDCTKSPPPPVPVDDPTELLDPAEWIHDFD